MNPQEAMMAKVNGRLLTLAQVAEQLQISRVTCWRLHAERGLRVIKIGRAIRVRESDLQAWLEQHSTSNGANELHGGTV